MHGEHGHQDIAAIRLPAVGPDEPMMRLKCNLCPKHVVVPVIIVQTFYDAFMERGESAVLFIDPYGYTWTRPGPVGTVGVICRDHPSQASPDMLKRINSLQEILSEAQSPCTCVINDPPRAKEPENITSKDRCPLHGRS